jgi:superfamily II DNA or RNA helicase
MPVPELKEPKKPGSAPPAEPKPQRPGGELFIVDNSDTDWKVAQYLSEWCDIARAFDIATGYFEIGALLALDGRWQQLEQIRILMGDEVNKRTRQAFETALGRIATTLNASLEREKETNDFLNGVPAIVAALQAGKIACRVYRERKFHAKAYITHSKFDVMGATALVGSSNFTYPGLHENVELNVRLRSEVEELQKWYEHYWDEAEEVTPDILKVIEPHIREYSPFEVYARSLAEFFKGHELTATEWELTESQMYPILDRYQQEGYHALMKIAERYGGALLCDGVGLGKTFIGLMLIERLIRDRKRVVLLVPKAAREPVWESKIDRYLPDVAGLFSSFQVFNHSDLLRGGKYVKDMAEIQRDADVIIIDEAHHFRNRAAKTYDKLFQMAEGKMLFLLTATPINNSLLDLQHEMELFSQRRSDHFKDLGIHSLPGHFRTLENALKKIVGEEDVGVELSQAEAERVLASDNLFRALVVQRSRAYVKQSQQQQGGPQALFPERKAPQVVDYSLVKTYGQLLDHLERAFRKDKPLLTLAIYYPLAYYTGSDASIDPLQEGRQAQVVGLIRTQLLKRFESSARAFEATCEELLLKLLAFVKRHSQSPAEQRRLTRWAGQHDDLLKRVQAHHVSAEDEVDEDIVTPEMLEGVEELSHDEYQIDEILDETYLDLDQLAQFLDDLKGFTPKRDDKLQALIKLLKNDSLLKKHKVLIFSEYMATARYVHEQLKKADLRSVDEVDSGVGRDRGEIITAFSPYYNDSSSAELAAKGAAETRILIATDVLSEGLNLQDATLLINYDLHWNPVRLMQRIGRVDRRLDPAVEAHILAERPEEKAVRGTVHFWNFLPPKELDRLLALYERVAHKTLRISKTFGIEGRKLLKPEDDYDALREFNQVYEGTPSSIEKMRLAYQELLKAHPGLEDRLRRFPLRVFSGKAHPTSGAQAVFLCYSLPARNVTTGEWDEEAGTAQWYLVDLESGKISEDAERIDAVIRSEPDTPRRTEMPQETLVDIRKKVEKHIANTYLKATQAPLGVKPILKAWMELN